MNKRIEFDFGGKKKIAKAKERKHNIAKGLAVGAAAGSAIGALSGVLFAPKSGKETRLQIKVDATEAAKKVAVDVKDASGKAAIGLKEFATKANGLVTEKLNSKRGNCCCSEAAVCEDEVATEITEEEENL